MTQAKSATGYQLFDGTTERRIGFYGFKSQVIPMLCEHIGGLFGGGVRYRSVKIGSPELSVFAVRRELSGAGEFQSTLEAFTAQYPEIGDDPENIVIDYTGSTISLNVTAKQYSLFVDTTSGQQTPLLPALYRALWYCAFLDALTIDRILLHCAAVIDKGRVFLLVAPSGGGKSTLVANVAVANRFAEEGLFIGMKNGLVLAWAGMWYAREAPDGNGYPVDLVYLLRKSRRIETHRCDRAFGLATLFPGQIVDLRRFPKTIQEHCLELLIFFSKQLVFAELFFSKTCDLFSPEVVGEGSKPVPAKS